MISMNWRREEHRPSIVDTIAGIPEGQSFRLPVVDPTPYFQANPLFADRRDADWFLERSWNQVAPMVGRQQGKVVIALETAKYVLLHRYGEGTIFDETGTANSPGFLRNMQSMPFGMVRGGDEIQLNPAILQDAPRLPGTWIIFYNGNLQNYFHWLVEGMLSLEILDFDLNLPAKTVLPQMLPREGQFDHVDIMNRLGHGHIEITRTSAPIVWCERVLHLEHMDKFPATRLRAFQARVARHYNSDDASRTRILVNRRSLRSIANIAPLEEILAPIGFQTVELEGLTSEGQIRLFGSAEFVVSPHGAGLSNLIYSPPGCRVIELMPQCEMRPFFWEIGSKLSHIYGMLPCTTDDGGFNGRLTVDLGKFKRLLNMVEAQH